MDWPHIYFQTKITSVESKQNSPKEKLKNDGSSTKQINTLSHYKCKAMHEISSQALILLIRTLWYIVFNNWETP